MYARMTMSAARDGDETDLQIYRDESDYYVIFQYEGEISICMSPAQFAEFKEKVANA